MVSVLLLFTVQAFALELAVGSVHGEHLDPAIVNTAQGDVHGIATSTSRRWLGIPFAAPPVGALRWQRPKPPSPWAPEIWNATDFRHNCLQSGTSVDMGWPQPRSTLSEDCLYLNIYAGPTPNMPAAPVLFWIYGGGFEGGGGNETRLNGTWDAELLRGELVIVTSNYRLGPFGFAASEHLSSRENALSGQPSGTGNYGILDQRRALTWVRENIHGFGGDPERVLLVGQSAGANSVSQHLVRPASWGLFSAAGMESGAFYDGFDVPTVSALQPTWDSFVRAAGCESTADITACLVGASADVILHASVSTPAARWNTPVVDGVDLLAPGALLASQGHLAKVPVFAGGVAEDINVDFGTRCQWWGCNRKDFVDAAMNNLGFTAAQADALADLYKDDAPRPGQKPGQQWYYAMQHAGADAWSNCAARRAVQWASSVNGGRAYWYYWSYVPQGPNGKGLAHHSVEQPFIFHVLNETEEQLREDGGKYHISAEEMPLSEELVRAWAAMAARGNPNVPRRGAFTWPSFNTSANGSALLIEGGGGSPPGFGTAMNYIAAKCALFDAVFDKDMMKAGSRFRASMDSAMLEIHI